MGRNAEYSIVRVVLGKTVSASLLTVSLLNADYMMGAESCTASDLRYTARTG